MASSQQNDFDKILETLEFKILSNVLKPRERLIEREIMEEYGVSRGTVRKILKELSFRNLVNHQSNRGAIVSEPTPKEVEDVYHTRMLLESHAIDFVVANIKPARLKKIENHQKAFEKALKEENVRGLFHHNRAFHQAMFDACGNSIVTELIDQLRKRSRVWFHYFRASSDQREYSVRDHLEMIEALNSKDTEWLKKINERHLITGYESYKKFMILM